MDELEQIISKHTRALSTQLAEYSSDRWPYTTLMEAAVVHSLGAYMQFKLGAMGKGLSLPQKRQLLKVRPFPSKVRLAPEMIIVNVSFGPRLSLERHIQENMAHHLILVDADTLMTTMISVSRFAAISMQKGDRAESAELQALLEGHSHST
jgi:hypothetical protein